MDKTAIRKFSFETTPKGINFKQCYTKRIELEIDGTTLHVIDLKNLRANKAASGRAQDLADLENLPPYNETS